MAYTVRHLATLSGVSVRTLHFYDEMGLLKPAFHGANGYRFYEQPQLLLLQQILFYRELGFELKQIQGVLGRGDFEIAAALKSHRVVLQKDLSRTSRLIETIDKTIHHLKGKTKMKSRELFAAFRVCTGRARFGERVKLGGEPIDCKVSAKDTDGAMCVFEFTGNSGGPYHLHYDQDEWVYVIEGNFDFLVGKKRFPVGAGESIFLPRKVGHLWGCSENKPGKIVNVYQPAGKMEQFFREVGRPFKGLITTEQLANKTYTKKQVEALRRLFHAHGMDLLPPPVNYEAAARSHLLRKRADYIPGPVTESRARR